MKTLLYIKGSPRKEQSKSAQVAAAFLEGYQAQYPDAVLDVLDVFSEPLPEFDGDRAAAKMSFFGDPAMDARQKTAWDEIVAITERFKKADDYLFTVPMWNGSIPYRLKLYIDIITQPGLLFGFDPAAGYSGLLSNKRATAIYTSGVFAPGVPPAFGTDHHSTYLDVFFIFIGITDIYTVRFQPNILTPQPAAGLEVAQNVAKAYGRR